MSSETANSKTASSGATSSGVASSGAANSRAASSARKLFASKPLTLGYVFLLGRMMEARLEDNRSTTSITKPNNLEETTFHKSNKVEETKARVEATMHKEKELQRKRRPLKRQQMPLHHCKPYVKNHWKEFMFIQERIWDPGIKIYFRHHREDKVVVKEWGMIRPQFG
nr:hypothetical protein [Tanacetum cinerariifolium]